MNENFEQNNDLKNQSNPTINTKQKSNKKRLFIIILILIIIVGLGYYKLNADRITTAPLDDQVLRVNSYHYDFSVKGFEKLTEDDKSNIENIFITKEYVNGVYFLTNVPSRASKVFAHGNFSNDDDENNIDFAILLEKDDFKSSKIFVISKLYRYLYVKEYDGELPTLSAFKKGAKIFMDDTKLVPSPSDGIMLHFKYKKTALLYVPKTKTYEEFTQYSDEDLKEMANNSEYDEGEEYNEGEELTYGTIHDEEGFTNLRKEKNAESLIIQEINSGEKVQIIDYDPEKDNWIFIRLESGVEGYVHKSRITIEGE